MMSGRSREAQVRFSERRRREDEALRLRVEVPNLQTLKLEVEERRGSSTLSETKHVRVVVIRPSARAVLSPLRRPRLPGWRPRCDLRRPSGAPGGE